MRSAWDPHLVAIERGAVLGREEAQISCSTKEGRGMSTAKQRPQRPLSLRRLSRDAFGRGAKAPDYALLLCRHCWSLPLGTCSPFPWAESLVCPAAPLSARRGAQAPHGHCAQLMAMLAL